MATSYGTPTGFLAYCSERGITPPSVVTGAIQSALQVASEWLDNIYRPSFPGMKTGGRDQEREWPRAGATDIYGYAIPSDTVPNEITYATYEAALQDMNSPGSLSVDYTPPKYKRVSVHGAISVEYAQYDSLYDMQMRFAKVDMWLSVITASRGPTDTGHVGKAYRV